MQAPKFGDILGELAGKSLADLTNDALKEGASEEEIEETLQKIQDFLELPILKLPVHARLREGYSEAVDILADDRRTYAGIGKLKTDQGRAIAVITVDYLNGDITQKQLLGPLEMITKKENA
jgi:hypothetical protein